MSIKIKKCLKEDHDKLLTTNEQIEEVIQKFINEEMPCHSTDGKTYIRKLKKAIKHNIVQYVGKEFSARIGFGYTSEVGIFRGIDNYGWLHFYVCDCDDYSVPLVEEFITSVDYILK